MQKGERGPNRNGWINERSKRGSEGRTMVNLIEGVAAALLLLAASCWASFSHVELPWQQYYRVVNQHTPDYKTGRPDRVRVGVGRFRILPRGAELICEFPSTVDILSNVIWERADLGALRDLDQMYKSLGETREYSVLARPKGSTLHLHRVSSLDRGLYRCIATAVDPATKRVVTLFQDVEFYPEYAFSKGYLPPSPPGYLPPPPGYLPPPSGYLPPPQSIRPAARPCCSFKGFYRDYRHQSSSFHARSSYSS